MFKDTLSRRRNYLQANGQCHALADLSPGKEFPLPIRQTGRALRTAPEGVEKRKFLPLRGLILRTLGRLARSQSLIPSALSRLPGQLLPH
jgi:hypothetical protein